MAVYQVMNNNLKRVFQNKMTYIWMLVIPIAIGLFGIFGNRITEKSIRVGIIENQGNAEILEKLGKLENIQYQIADKDTIHTEQIMGKYQYVIDIDEIEKANAVINELEKVTEASENTNPLSVSARMAAMLMTAYMVIATLYAAKVIQDRDMGVIERFCLAGEKRLSYFGGYVVSTVVIVGVQIGIAFLLLSVLDKDFLPDMRIKLLAAVMITGITTLYGVIHAFLYKKEMTANIMSSSVAILLSILGGTFVAVEKMPMVLQQISVISPVRWLLEIIG